MYSILKKIDNHIRENDIKIKSFMVSSRLLPANINRAILHEVRSFKDEFFDSFYKDITFSYDAQGRLYMLVHDVRKRKNIFIIDDNYMLDVNIPKDRVVYEKEIIRNSCMLRYVDKYMDNVRKNIDANNDNLSRRRKSIMEYEALKEVLKKANKQLVDKNKDILQMVNYTDSLHRSTSKINNYVDYLDNYYNENVLIRKVKKF